MIKTRVCERLGIEYPIIQGGMAWVSTAELAAAVSEAGALGIIAAGNLSGVELRREIRKARELTRKPFGVNALLLSPFIDEIMEVIIEERVEVVATGAGNPGKYIPSLKERGIKILPLVASVALAKRLERQGVDAVVAEGMESGGHIGEVTTMALVPQIAQAIEIPVIAAGGIANGKGMAAALALGAEAIQMGSRFVCSTECTVHPAFKESYLRAKDRDTVITGRSTGHPVRVIKNKLSREFERLEKNGASLDELNRLGEGKLRAAAREGDIEYGSVMAGQIVGLINDIRPVKEIIQGIMEEATATIKSLPQKFIS
jgi:enoyl-[acyl-carrier protein] reductase II